MKLQFITAWPNDRGNLIRLLKKTTEMEIFTVRRFGDGRAHLIRGKGKILLDEAFNFIRMVTNPRFYCRDAGIICNSSQYSCLLFAKWLRMFRKRKRLYLYYFYIHRLGQVAVIRKILQFLLKGDIALIVQSEPELKYFKKMVPPLDVCFFPYCTNQITSVDVSRIQFGNYVFAGGYTNRDYKLFVECASHFPNTKFVIVCSILNKTPNELPENVQIYRDIEIRKFHNLLAGCRLVVVPLKHDVGASGQMVVLAAMQFGKAVIYAGCNVIEQYFEDGVSGMKYEVGNRESLCAQIRKALSDTKKTKEIGEKARERYLKNFTRDEFDRRAYLHMVNFFGFDQIDNIN